MSSRMFAITCLWLLGACVPGSDTQLRFAASEGQLQVDPVQADDHDYVVRVGNVGDIGYDPDVPETRQTIALSAVKAQCPNAAIVGEQAVQTGNIPLRGKPAITYHIKVKCG